MSISTDGAVIPEWDLADRLAKALRIAGLTASGMADYLEVHRNTVSAWINGRTPPSAQTVRLWALRTGVPHEWLRTGYVSPSGDGPEDGPAVDAPDVGPADYTPSLYPFTVRRLSAARDCA